MTQTITAMYDTYPEATAAKAKLVALGIPEVGVRILSGGEAGTSTTSMSQDGGMWGSLKEFFMPEDDRHVHAEGLHRGGTMLTATVEDGYAEQTYDIMEEHGSVDMDEREASWRKDGWDGRATGSTAGTAPVAAGMIGEGALSTDRAATTRDTDLHAAGAPESVSARGAATDADYIPVVEERLNVGKRMVDSGRVRVRSYAVEKAVSENVTLRDETVHVDRRVVDRAVTPGDMALFEDKVIEATEMREQAVVSKEARVVGEVGIRKEASDRVETVTDKVRHTEVEVTDERGTVSRTGTAGTATGTVPHKPL
ncbi:YsnF/AvaK domain-containing protein [Methylobacterium sp. J-092]|uniref:YsnF/AvaK domain-containing protein n=1 Tax=Methylobacterium sp. J-092 TaxID=2836667 RepID=UPI001FBB96F9|nr:YsnF/AvaK domain-containing protein [Methylobacterium sp. J-092]MCJ2009329.1 YsnF/AvaK domain-containing protein [Methylobacterium sp. J-092]